MMGNLAATMRTAGTAMSVGPRLRAVLPRTLGIAVKAIFARTMAAMPSAVVAMAARSLVAVARNVPSAMAVARVAVKGMRWAAVMV